MVHFTDNTPGRAVPLAHAGTLSSDPPHPPAAPMSEEPVQEAHTPPSPLQAGSRYPDSRDGDDPVPDSAVGRDALLRAVEHGPAAVVITDRRGRIVYVNPSFTRITGYTLPEVMWKTPRVLKSGVQSSAFYGEMWTTILAGRPWSGELWNRRKNGELYWETLSISPVLDARGEVDRFVAVLEDATERKGADERLRMAREAVVAADRARSTFMASISHEVRTPLTTILGFTRLLLADTTLAPSQKEKLESISSAGAHLLGLLNDVLEISRTEAGRATLRPMAVDLPLFFGDLQRMFQPMLDARGLSFEVLLDDGTPSHVITDPGRLRQVLMNLLDNAARFTEQGGVKLRVFSTANEADRCTLIIEVIDTGPGIDESEVGQVFEPFVQTATSRRLGGGTGLGLALSRDYMNLLGGEIGLSSRLGCGTTVRLTLPVRSTSKPDEEPPEAQGRTHRLRPGQGPFRVLVADDDIQGRFFLSGLLQQAGFETREASDGDEAVAMFGEWRPELVFVDLWMPGLDGFEATRQIRAHPHGRDARIIVMTTRAFAQGATDAVMAGADEFVTVPLRMDEIFAKIRMVLGAEFDGDDPSGIRRGSDSAPRVGTRLTREDLDVLPPHLIEALRQATDLLDFEWLGRIADQAESHAPEVAKAMRELLSRFDHRTLAALLGNGSRTP